MKIQALAPSTNGRNPFAISLRKFASKPIEAGATDNKKTLTLMRSARAVWGIRSKLLIVITRINPKTNQGIGAACTQNLVRKAIRSRRVFARATTAKPRTITTGARSITRASFVIVARSRTPFRFEKLPPRLGRSHGSKRQTRDQSHGDSDAKSPAKPGKNIAREPNTVTHATA